MGFGRSIGKILNDATGATSSSNQAYKQSVGLANLSYKQQKEFAQNAHQWEMQDLQKAGLNPALTTGASSAGAIAGGGATGGSGTTGGASGIGILSELSNVYNTTRQTDAKTNLDNAQAMATIEMLPFDKDVKLQMIQKINTDAQMNLSNIDFNKRRASGKGWSAGAGPIRGSYNY